MFNWVLNMPLLPVISKSPNFLILLHGQYGKGSSLAFVGVPSINGVTIKVPYEVDVFTSTSFTAHLFLLGWLKLNPALILVQLRLAWGDKSWW